MSFQNILKAFFYKNFSRDDQLNRYVEKVKVWSKGGKPSEGRKEAAARIVQAVINLWMKPNWVHVDLSDLNLRKYPPTLLDRGLSRTVSLKNTIEKEKKSSIIALNILKERGLKKKFEKYWAIVEVYIEELSQYQKDLETWREEGNVRDYYGIALHYLEEEALKAAASLDKDIFLHLNGRDVWIDKHAFHVTLRKEPPLTFFRSSVRKIDLSDNQLTEILEIKGYSKLEQLDLSSNCLTDIPDLEGCSALLTLDLSNNPLQDNLNVENIKKLKSLKSLSIHKRDQNQPISHITTFPVLRETQLEFLDISGNLLDENTLAQNLHHASSLKHLIMQRTGITSFPDLRNSNIEILDLSNNSTFNGIFLLENFPVSLKHLILPRLNLAACPDLRNTKIKILDLSSCAVIEREFKENRYKFSSIEQFILPAFICN